MEKKYRTNIELSQKRTLVGFKETSILFIKENCYYLLQKYIIKEIFIFCGCFQNIQNSYSHYFNEWQNSLKELTKCLLQ